MNYSKLLIIIIFNDFLIYQAILLFLYQTFTLINHIKFLKKIKIHYQKKNQNTLSKYENIKITKYDLENKTYG